MLENIYRLIHVHLLILYGVKSLYACTVHVYIYCCTVKWIRKCVYTYITVCGNSLKMQRASDFSLSFEKTVYFEIVRMTTVHLNDILPCICLKRFSFPIKLTHTHTLEFRWKWVLQMAKNRNFAIKSRVYV